MAIIRGGNSKILKAFELENIFLGLLTNT